MPFFKCISEVIKTKCKVMFGLLNLASSDRKTYKRRKEAIHTKNFYNFSTLHFHRQIILTFRKHEDSNEYSSSENWCFLKTMNVNWVDKRVCVKL